MRLLVLGGTSFVGHGIVEAALGSDIDVTLFGRGRTGADLFPQLVRLRGDRDSDDYDSIRAGSWDAVVDVSGYVPRHVDQAMQALDDRVGRYLFISSHAVYETAGLDCGATEDAARRRPLRDTEKIDANTYGPLKVACEDAVWRRYGTRATIVRPGKVAGPRDPSGAFTYWVRRAARGGRVAVPADPRQPVQVIDVRDLAHLVVHLLQDDRSGAFQAVGPSVPITLGGLIEVCAGVAGAEVEVVRVAADGLPPLFPLVRPHWATQQRSAARALKAGMTATPLEVTATDVLAWDRRRGEPALGTGFSCAEERARLTGR